MDDLDRQLESYTRRYQEASQASPEAVEGALDRVVERVAAGDPGMDLGTDVTASGAAGAATGKVVVLVLVGGAIAGAAWLGTREPPEATRVDAHMVASTSAQDVGAPAGPAAAVAPAEPEPVVATVVSAKPRALRRSHEAEAEPEPAPADTMLEELELLRRARAAQRGGELERALELLAEHGRRFPESALGEERMATRVVVLCGLGRLDQAKTAEAELRKRHPQSTYLEIVRGACAPEATHAGAQGQAADEKRVPQIPTSADMAGPKE